MQNSLSFSLAKIIVLGKDKLQRTHHQGALVHLNLSKFEILYFFDYQENYYRSWQKMSCGRARYQGALVDLNLSNFEIYFYLFFDNLENCYCPKKQDYRGSKGRASLTIPELQSV
ncbi:hypothetical protein CFP56_043844 [Quercus suber]|uniref:Uncharacterized protein n=1 Tax=Quercus suber TaxID=58331 RepID=A0AAW0LIE5_QUESU